MAVMIDIVTSAEGQEMPRYLNIFLVLGKGKIHQDRKVQFFCFFFVEDIVIKSLLHI